MATPGLPIRPASPMPTPFTFDALVDVVHERQHQDNRWGFQHHPSGAGSVAEILMPISTVIANRTGAPVSAAHYGAAGLALAAKEATDVAASRGTLTWSHILLEEVFEALAEDDPERRAAELIQVAAVALAMVEDIRFSTVSEPTA